KKEQRGGDSRPDPQSFAHVCSCFNESFEYVAPKRVTMSKGRRKLLVGQTYNRPEEFAPLKRYSDIYWLDEMDAEELARVLPSIDCLYSHGWPKALDAGKISKMKNL